MRVAVLVVLQDDVPFPVDAMVFSNPENANAAKERIEKQYEGNRCFILHREVEDVP